VSRSIGARLRAHAKRAGAAGVGALVAVLLGACGGATAPGVALAPSTGGIGAATSRVHIAQAADAPAVGTPKPPSPLSKEPLVTTPKGALPTRLVVKDVITGTGERAKPNDSVTVNYVGVLYKSGKVFDSSWQRKQTFTAPLSNGSVISGWVRGIVGERVGGRRELIIPPNLAYGRSGSAPKIPSNATLVFDVDLLSVSADSGDG
jgi:peptidylprolyl isomerase